MQHRHYPELRLLANAFISSSTLECYERPGVGRVISRLTLCFCARDAAVNIRPYQCAYLDAPVNDITIEIQSEILMHLQYPHSNLMLYVHNSETAAPPGWLCHILHDHLLQGMGP